MISIFRQYSIKAAIYVLAATISLACSPRNNNQSIEVFQVIETRLDHSLFEEMKRETLLYKDIDFKFHTTASTVKEQIEEIEYAIANKAECIIVVCKDEREVLPVIEKAYDSGVMVVILGQKIDSRKYTALIGRDIRKGGRKLGELILDNLPEGGIVAKLVSEETENRYHEFKEGMEEVLEARSDIVSKRFDSVEDLEKAVSSSPIDLILSPSEEKTDQLSHSNLLKGIKCIGIDGNIEWGIDAIEENILSACIVNRQGGATAINTAVSIVKGLRFDRDMFMDPITVTHNNVELAAIGDKEHSNLVHKVDLMDESFRKLIRKNENMTMILIGMLALFVILELITLEISRIRTNEEDKHQKQAMEALEAEKKELQINNEINEIIVNRLKEEKAVLLEAMTAQDSRNVIAADPMDGAVLMSRFKKLLESEYSDADLSIDSLAKSLGISRTQLFKKVKAASGLTPNDILQNLRLEKGRELLSTGKASVSEAAYSVGFSSPSYFTKCYKEKFGNLPSGTKS